MRHWLTLGLLGVFVFGLLGLLRLFGCSRLPTIVPDLSHCAGPLMQIERARGPLSAAQSEAILDRVTIGGKDRDIFERHPAPDPAIADSLLTTGNQVLLLPDGPTTLQARHAAVMAARDHINMEI